MTNTTIRALLISAMVLSGCSGGTSPQANGPVKVGIVSGNNQSVAAAPSKPLPQTVVAQVIRLPDGTSSLRILDALLPPNAYAQTAVDGVPNQAVCQAAPKPDERALKADIPCTISDATGKAYLTFLHDSIAGPSIARVGVSTPAGTQITDSVQATVLPGVASPTYLAPQTPILNFPATVPATSVVDQYGNAVSFRIVPDGRLVVQDTTTGSVGARTLVSGIDDQADYIVELRGSNNALVGRARYRVIGGVLRWFAAGGTQTSP